VLACTAWHKEAASTYESFICVRLHRILFVLWKPAHAALAGSPHAGRSLRPCVLTVFVAEIAFTIRTATRSTICTCGQGFVLQTSGSAHAGKTRQEACCMS
jgi:hypothetical protein